MTPETWTRYIPILVPLLLALIPVMLAAIALGTAIVGYLVARLTGTVTKIQKENVTAIAENTATTNETKQKADAIIEKTAEIHVLTNGNYSKLQTALEVAMEKMAAMGEEIISLKTQMTEMIASKREAAAVAEWVAKKEEKAG